MSVEFDRLMRDNLNPPTTPCMLTSTHEAHLWWYTSSGGGHMLDNITEGDLATEKGLKRHLCPGKIVDAALQAKIHNDAFSLRQRIAQIDTIINRENRARGAAVDELATLQSKCAHPATRRQSVEGFPKMACRDCGKVVE